MSAGLSSRFIARRRDYYHAPGLKPPRVSNVNDFEFADYKNGTNPSTIGLTWGNQGTRTASIIGGRLYLNTPTSSNTRGGLFIADPTSGGSWSMTVRLAMDGAGSFPHAGLGYIVGGLTTPTDSRYLIFTGSSAAISLNDYAGSWGGYEGTASGSRTIRSNIHGAYLRLVYNGTGTLDSYFSFDPLMGEWISTGQYTGLTDPSHIGVATIVDGAGEGTMRAVYDFIRFDWTPDYDPRA